MTAPVFENQLRPEFLGVHAFNPWVGKNSASRGTMFASHFAQRLVLLEQDEAIYQTGIEQDFAKYTFSVKMPDNGRIIRVIPLYPQSAGAGAINENPETLVIYENERTHEIDCFTIPRYQSYHQYFGFKNVAKPNLDKLRHGAYITKDTVFMDTPGVADSGTYTYGVNMNTAFMSLPGVAEDAVVISNQALDRLKFLLLDRREVELGSKEFALNLYGTVGDYKAFPDIGEYIRDDGLLMMMRSYEKEMAPADMSIFDVAEPDFIFDRGVYVRGVEGRTTDASGKVRDARGKVVDIRVIRNNNQNQMLPTQMTEQLNKYAKANIRYYQEIVETDAHLRREHRKKHGESKIPLSPRLSRLVVDSLAVLNHNAVKMKQNLNLLFRKSPVDEYRIEFVIEYVVTPDNGYKLTGKSGDGQ